MLGIEAVNTGIARDFTLECKWTVSIIDAGDTLAFLRTANWAGRSWIALRRFKTFLAPQSRGIAEWSGI
jgi:hypothetical protein